MLIIVKAKTEEEMYKKVKEKLDVVKKENINAVKNGWQFNLSNINYTRDLENFLAYLFLEEKPLYMNYYQGMTATAMKR